MVREQYEVRWKDYYETLQVHPKAEAEVIAAAYRRLAMMYHPDRNKAPDAQDKFKLINEAHEVLSDPDRRARYDLVYQQIQNGASADNSSSQHESADWTYGGWGANSDQYSEGYGDSGWDYARQDTWYEEPEPARADAPDRDYPTYEPEYEPRPESIFSLAFVRWLLSRLADKVSPNPDESQKILPWPSWKWQRLWLIASIPLYAILVLVSGAQGAWGAFVLVLILLGCALYAGRATSWMRESQNSPAGARIAGGTAITLSGISYALMIAYLVFSLFLLVIYAIIGFAILRGMLSHYLGGGRR